MTNQISQVHRTTPAETVLMAAIDQVINQLPQRSMVMIDYDFLRDYTILQLLKKYQQAGKEACVEMACMSVHLHRCYFTRKQIAKLHYV